MKVSSNVFIFLSFIVLLLTSISFVGIYYTYYTFGLSTITSILIVNSQVLFFIFSMVILFVVISFLNTTPKKQKILEEDINVW